MPVIDLVRGRSTVGRWSFDEAPRSFSWIRAVDGVRILLPSSIELPQDDALLRVHRYPMVSQLRATVFVPGKPEVDLGVAEAGEIHCAFGGPWDLQLWWSASMASLAFFEKRRNGGPVQLRLACEAMIGWQQGQSHDMTDNLLLAARRLKRDVTVTYPTDVWNALMMEQGIVRTVCVPFDLPPSRPSPWNEVWNALVEAQQALSEGGSTGWKACASAVRLALEKWQAIEAVDHGPGWVSPSRADRDARSKKQRIDNVRWDLHQLAHLGPHGPADEWTRDDAQLLLTVLAGLLSVRQP